MQETEIRPSHACDAWVDRRRGPRTGAEGATIAQTSSVGVVVVDMKSVRSSSGSVASRCGPGHSQKESRLRFILIIVWNLDSPD